MTKICSVSKKSFFQLFCYSNPQTVFVGSKQSVSYKTQSGRTYGPMTSCKVNFKVISRLPSKTAISTIYGIVLYAKLHFVFWSLNVYCRRWLPVPPWWCPVQPLMSFTQEETAKGKRAIHSQSERKGLTSYTAVGVVLCGCGSMWVWVWFYVDTFNYFAFPRFCGNNGPDRLPVKGKSAAVVFKSDKKGNGGGADCTIACSDFSPTGQIHCKLYCIAAKQCSSCGQNMVLVVYLSFAEKHWLKNFSESF